MAPSFCLVSILSLVSPCQRRHGLFRSFWDKYLAIFPSIEEEVFLPPPLEGPFMPWASGPRICPGKKFAQVQFVAAIAQLFRDHRVEPVLKAGEQMGHARRRIYDAVWDSTTVLALRMKHPENVAIRWVPRA